MKILHDFNLTAHSYFRTKSLAKKFILIESTEDLFSLVNELQDTKYFIIGNGSNLLFKDTYYHFPIVSLKELKGIESNNNQVIALAGTPLSQILTYYAEKNMGGLEFLTSIPANLGGALYMNAGAYADEILNHITSISLINIQTKITRDHVVKKEDYSYRKQHIVKPNEIIVSAKFKNTTIPFDSKKAQEIKKMRFQKFPKNPNGGSVFKNLENQKAWELIKNAGLSGYTVGGARVSLEHANIIENFNQASGMDIYNLIQEIKNKIFDLYSINLHEEIQIL